MQPETQQEVYQAIAPNPLTQRKLRKMNKIPWIVAIADGRQTIKCKRCNASYTPNLPISIDMYISLSKAFIKTHKHCQAVNT